VLWVSQEVLKQLSANPTWPGPFERTNLLQLRWDDEEALQAETAENTRLLLKKRAAKRQSPTKLRKDLPKWSIPISGAVSKRGSLKPSGKEKSGKIGLLKRVQRLFIASK